MSKLEIQEFRGIRRLVRLLELAKFNVLIGRNNTGKTTILEALYMLSGPWPDIKDPILWLEELAGSHIDT